jgi:hypothetical protein
MPRVPQDETTKTAMEKRGCAKVFPPFYWVLKKEKERIRIRKERNR